MLNIKDLKEKYTFSELAHLLRLDKKKIEYDFKKNLFTAKKEIRKFSVSANFGSGRFTAKKKTWVVSQAEVLRYIKYLRIKNIIE